MATKATKATKMRALSPAENAECDALAKTLLSDSLAPKFAASPTSSLSRLSDVFKELRGRNIQFFDILAVIKQIAAILNGGGDWAALLAAILALFNQTP